MKSPRREKRERVRAAAGMKRVDRVWIATAWGGDAGYHVGMTWTTPDGAAHGVIISLPPKGAPASVKPAILESPTGRDLVSIRGDVESMMAYLKRIVETPGPEDPGGPCELEAYDIDGDHDKLVNVLAGRPWARVIGAEYVPMPETMQ